MKRFLLALALIAAAFSAQAQQKYYLQTSPSPGAVSTPNTNLQLDATGAVVASTTFPSAMMLNSSIPLTGSKSPLTWTDPYLVGTYAIHQLSVPSDNATLLNCVQGNCPAISDLFINHILTGGSTGARIPLWVNIGVTGLTIDYPNSLYYQPAYFTAEATANQGGTGLSSTLSYGSLVGVGTNITLRSGATFWGIVNTMEGDTGILDGASAYARQGYASVGYGNKVTASQATNAATANGNSTLNFASVPAAVAAGQLVIDASRGGVLTSNTYVVSKTATTVTISVAATGTGVASGDIIQFNVPSVGAGYDAAYQVGMLGGWSGAWVIGLSFDNSHGAWGVDNCGALIATPLAAYTYTPCGVATDHKAAFGIDFTGMTFGSFAIATPGGINLLGANRSLQMGQDAANGAYNVICFNGVQGDSSCNGLQGGATGDDKTYFRSAGVITAINGVSFQLGSTTTVLALGEMGWPKITASGSAPGAGTTKTEWTAGTNAGTCKMISYAGTSTTPVTIIDNVGAGC